MKYFFFQPLYYITNELVIFIRINGLVKITEDRADSDKVT